MARDNNTYAKRQREMQKRQKADDKRVRREKRKEQAGQEVGQVEGSNGDDRPADVQ